MIRYTCPTCSSQLQAQVHEAGTKGLCPRCGQKLLVPKPPEPIPTNKTVLGKLDDLSPPTALPPPLPPPVPAPLYSAPPQSLSQAPPAYYPQDYYDEPRPIRRRRRDDSPGFGITAMVLGIVAIPFSCVLFGIPGLIFAIMAIVFGSIGKDTRNGQGMAIAGLVLGLVVIGLWVVLLLFFVLYFGTVANSRHSPWYW